MSWLSIGFLIKKVKFKNTRPFYSPKLMGCPANNVFFKLFVVDLKINGRRLMRQERNKNITKKVTSEIKNHKTKSNNEK